MSKPQTAERGASAGRRASAERRASGMRVSLALCAAVLVGPAFGHAKLLESSPAAGAEIRESPPSLTLTFNEDVRLGVLKLTTAGHAVPLAIDPNPASARVITIKLPPLTAGTYDVQWSALTPSDGHVVKGRYTFVIR
jgi:methionine-rich copper-binding protein CopC